MAEQCECKAEEITILPCSGGSNCGQIANQAAVSLDTLGVGKIYCLAGISAGFAQKVLASKGMANFSSYSMKIAGVIIVGVGIYLFTYLL